MKLRRLLLIWMAAALATALISGCGPPYPGYEDLYSGLTEKLEKPDRSVLEGRRIVIDPGHGGSFRGAFGSDSLAEADVNLGTALYLWGLLKESGADVVLTRTTDRDFLKDNETELKSDLSNRMEYANSFDPEVFISIHHNSNLPRDREKNAIEIFYRESDPGPSLLLGREIHKHLARNLGIAESCIKPGNYHVLRNSSAGAAILGEASYLSNPAVESRLRLSNKQRLEAEAYFLGLMSYFGRGIPRLQRLSPSGDTIREAEKIVYRADSPGHVPVDPSTAGIIVDGNEIETVYSVYSNIITGFIDQDAFNGIHPIQAYIETVKGGMAYSRPFRITLDRPAAHIIPLQPRWLPGGRIEVSFRVLDDEGRPVADGKPVALLPPGNNRCQSASPSPEKSGSAESSFPLQAACHRGLASFRLKGNSPPGEYIVMLPGLSDTVTYHFIAEKKPYSITIKDSLSDSGIPGPLVLVSRDGKTLQNYSGNSDGIVLMDVKPEGKLNISAPGYRPSVTEGEELPLETAEVKLYPWFQGSLHRVRISIDPAGGGTAHQGISKNKLRGAGLNLDTSRRVARILRHCGADVMITRQGEENLSVEERIHHVNSFRPAAAIRLMRKNSNSAGESSCIVLHYPGSTGGTALADSLARELSAIPPCRNYITGESASVFLSHTSCPAVEIRSRPVKEGKNETVYSNPIYPLLEAEAITTAVIRYFAAGVDIARMRAEVINRGEPVEDATICVDRIFTLKTNREGYAVFNCLEPGVHTVTVEKPAHRASVFTVRLTGGQMNRCRFEMGN